MNQRPATLVSRQSAGGVVYRKGGGAIHVALVSVRGGEIWTLPKGLVDEGESLEHTALREVREEAGVRARLVGDLGESSYWYFIKSDNVKCRKTVKYFLMEYVDGDVADHDHEVSGAEWVPLGDALGRLDYKGDRSVMHRALEMLSVSEES